MGRAQKKLKILLLIRSVQNKRLPWLYFQFCVFLLVLGTFCSHGYSQSSSVFLDEVLEISDMGPHNWIVVRIKVSNNTSESIIRNVDLYDYLVAIGKISSKMEFESYFKELVRTGESLAIEDETQLEVYEFNPVLPQDEIAAFASKGCKCFVEHYFTSERDSNRFGLLRMDNVGSLKDMHYVAVLLFRWNIPSYIDDISGRLVIAGSCKST